MSHPTGVPWLQVLLDPSSTAALRAEAAQRLAGLSPSEIEVQGDYLRVEAQWVPSAPRALPPWGLARRLARRHEDLQHTVQTALRGHPDGWAVPIAEGPGWVAAARALLACPDRTPMGVQGLRSAWLPHGAVDTWRAACEAQGVPMDRRVVARALAGGHHVPRSLAQHLVALLSTARCTVDELERALGRLHSGLRLLLTQDTWLPLNLRVTAVVADVIAAGDLRDPVVIDRLERTAWHWMVVAFAETGVQAALAVGRDTIPRFDVLDVLEQLGADVTDAAWLALGPVAQTSIHRMESMLAASSSRR